MYISYRYRSSRNYRVASALIYSPAVEHSTVSDDMTGRAKHRTNFGALPSARWVRTPAYKPSYVGEEPGIG